MKSSKAYAIVAFVWINLLSLVAMAQAAAPAALQVQQEWWQNLIVHLVGAVITIFVPVLSYLAYTLAKRWGVNIELDTVDKILAKAVGFAEQKAKKALNDGAGKTGAAEKLDWALSMATDMSKKYGLSKKATDKLNDLIEAKLGEEVVKKNGTTTAATPPSE